MHVNIGVLIMHYMMTFVSSACEHQRTGAITTHLNQGLVRVDFKYLAYMFNLLLCEALYELFSWPTHL